MRIVVLGATGMLGSAVYGHFRSSGWDVIGTVRGGHSWNPAVGIWRYDAAASPSTRWFVQQGDMVVNCIGAIRQKPFSGPEMAYLNTFLPHSVADECRGVGARMIHISTDCVFNGDDGPYDESDEITADDIYGRSKAFGEPPDCLVIRTSIIGRSPSIAGLAEWFLSRKGRVDGYTNHLWNGVTTGEIAKAIEAIVEGDLYVHGIRHVHSEDMTKFDILVALRERYGCESVVVPVPGPRPADRRLRTIYPGFLGKLGIRTFREMISDLP